MNTVLQPAALYTLALGYTISSRLFTDPQPVNLYFKIN